MRLSLPGWARSRRTLLGVGMAAILAAGGIGVAAAATSSSPPSNAVGLGKGIDEYGMTQAFFNGQTRQFTYTKGFYCDRTVSAASTSKCEAGAGFNKAPAQYDPLYITVPLGFNQPMNMLDCPSGLVCVDHPGTIDLSRLEPALKPLYPQLTDAQLTAALKNFATPGHDHFITDLNGGRPEFWDVVVIGVTSPAKYQAIRQHQSFAYIQSLLNAKDPNVVGPIPTNLFLYFGVEK